MMKMYLTFIVLAMNLVMAFTAKADVYIVLTGGNGGEAKASSIGGEIGWIGKQFLLGFGYSLTNNDEVSGPTSVGTNTPTKGQESVDPNTTKTEKENEFYFSGGIRIVDKLFLVANTGYSQQLVKFHSALFNTTFDENAKDRFTYGGQLQYNIKQLVISCGYHNRRGVVGKFGFSF
jgi:hypothetical protein